MSTVPPEVVADSAPGHNGSGPPITERSLARKLAEVMVAIERVPKRGRNPHHGYDYATEADISAAIQKELGERGVAFLPTVTAWERHEGLTARGNPTAIWYAFMDMTLEDGDSGEVRTTSWIGVGEDPSDKGMAKAFTNAVKYFLLKTFLVPTGDDPEADAHDGPARGPAAADRRGQAGQRSAAQDPKPAGQRSTGGQRRPRPISDAQRRRLFKIAQNGGLVIEEEGKAPRVDSELVKRICRFITRNDGVVELADLTTAHYDAVVKGVEKYGPNRERAEAAMKAWEAEQASAQATADALPGGDLPIEPGPDDEPAPATDDESIPF